MSIKKQRLVTEITTEIAAAVAAKILAEAASGLGYRSQIQLVVPVVQAQQGLRISGGTELTQTELVQTELMWTKLVWTELIQTELDLGYSSGDL